MSEKVQRRKLNRRRHSRSGVFFYLPNIILGIVLLGVIFYLLTVTVFRTESVKVSGNTILSNTEIENTVVTGKYKKYGLIQVVKRLVKPVKNLPFATKVTVSIWLADPHTLRIHVTEPSMLGYITLSNGKYAYFNDEGTVVQVSDKLVDGLLPVNGISCKSAEKGKLLPINRRCRRVLLQLTKSLRKYNIAADSITFKDEREVSVQSGSVIYDFGSFDYLQEKLMRLPYITPSLTGLSGTLHMETWTPENTDIVFEKTG